ITDDLYCTSRRRHTRSKRDWSSDVCSSDLGLEEGAGDTERGAHPRLLVGVGVGAALGIAGSLFQAVTRNPLGSPDVIGLNAGARSEARRVGREWGASTEPTA